MKKEDREMMEKIVATEKVGYAYLYLQEGEGGEEFYLSTTAENMANFVGSHIYDAEKIIITDVCDLLILDTIGGYLNNCPDQKLCGEVIAFLTPIQMGEKEAEEVLRVRREIADAYFNREEEQAIWAEMKIQ